MSNEEAVVVHRFDRAVEVLIVGGGPCGLSASLALSRLGIASMLVERHPGTAPQPKALHLSTRTMEVLRAWGVADDIRALALPLRDHALFHGRSMADPDYVRHAIWPADPQASPERPYLVSQEVLEPELRRLAEGEQGVIRFGTRLVGVRQDDEGVVAEVEHLADGVRSLVTARYVIAADGAASTVRTLAGIDFPGHVVHDSVNIRFRADLRALLADRRSAFYYVQNDQVRGLLPVVDNATDWRLHLMMSEGETLADYESTDRRSRLVRAAVGDPDLDVELLPLFGWTAAARVASRYRAGRLFLVGDAAHVNPPSGGLGMNCGIQDVHNLVWKLAAVLQGGAEPGLLDTYEPERRPLGLRTVAEAELNHVFEAAPVHTDEDRRRKHDRRRMAGLVLGHHYTDGAFTPDGTAPPAVDDPYVDYAPTARPGHRAPHVWLLRAGLRISSLDLFGWTRPTLLVGPDADVWRAAADVGSVAVVTVGGPAGDVTDVEGDGTLLTRYGIGCAGAVLVRQDGFVAMRDPVAPESVAAGRERLATAFDRASVCGNAPAVSAAPARPA